MHSVSLFIEILRVRPLALFWSALVTQAALWTLVPTLFYTAPPGQVADLLAVGHEFQLGTDFGPPLAFWLGEVVYMIAGFFGVYLLSQICVAVAFWAVFSVGRSIVGDRQATMAVLLMVGIMAFTVPTTDFGPSVLATALWALALLHYWRAVGEGRRTYWFVLGLDIGLLVLTSYSALILVGLLLVFTLLSARGRAQLATLDPWLAGIIAVMIVFPHLIWFDQTGGVGFVSGAAVEQNLWAWVRMATALVIGHVGLAILVALANGFWLRRRGAAPVIIRHPIDPLARNFVYFFAISPIVSMLLLTLFTPRPDGFLATPLVVFSGLAVIVAAGERIRIVSTAADRARLDGAARAAAAAGGGGRGLPAVDADRRSAGGAAGNRDGALLCRQLPAPHRSPARSRGRQSAHRGADCAHRAVAAEPVPRRHA